MCRRFICYLHCSVVAVWMLQDDGLVEDAADVDDEDEEDDDDDAGDDVDYIYI